MNEIISDVRMGSKSNKCPYKRKAKDFPVGTEDKNPPANAGDTGLIPGPGRFHML